MKEEDKHLLLNLCSGLPYGVKVECEQEVCKLSCCSSECVYIEFPDADMIVSREADEVKPYLFPLSSMTEEQKSFFEKRPIELDKYGDISTKEDASKNSQYADLCDYLEVIDWLNKNHFDYRGLIENGLAIDATGLEIY